MSMLEILQQIENSTLARAVSKSDHMVAASLQVVHVLGFTLLLAALALLGLRLLGLVLADHPTALVARGATRLLWWGLCAAAVSGVLMFIATPQLYAHKPVFLTKMALLATAVLLQATVFRQLARAASPGAAHARAVVLLSATAWIGVAAAGRIIGFV